METKPLKSPQRDSEPKPKLSWLLTPPKPSNPSSSKTPTEYLQDPLLLPNLKRKSSLNLSQESVKLLRFDPEPLTSDQTILQYHHRLIQSEFSASRQKLCVEMPFADIIEEVRDMKRLQDKEKDKNLKQYMDQNNKEFQKLKQYMEEKDEEFKKFKQDIEERDESLKEHIEMQLIINGTNVKNHKQYVIWRKGQDEQKLLFFRANFFPVFAETLFRRLGIRTTSIGSNDADHCSDRYANVYDMIVDNQRTKWENWTCLRKKYLNDMKTVQPLFKERNLVAHQSQAEFARLLVDPVFTEHQEDAEENWFVYYSALFAYVYRHEDGSPMTLEQCASLSEKQLANRIMRSETPKPDLSQSVKFLGVESNDTED
ncbi:MAG: hypothetical protein Q9205_004717 [Flavoplaca limonia]